MLNNENRAQISRENGAKSKGPITNEGKEKVSQNATKHGGYSHRVVIRGESQEIYDQIYAAYWAEYKPETLSEADCVEDIINSRWKIRRLEAMETNYLDMADTLYEGNDEFQQATPDSRHRACFNHLVESQPGFTACVKFLERYQRANSRALRNLDRIRKRSGKPAISLTPNEIEKDFPSNTAPEVPESPISPKPPVSATPDPKPPKSEQGKTILELLLIMMLVITITAFSCQSTSRKAGSNLKPATEILDKAVKHEKTHARRHAGTFKKPAEDRKRA